MYTLVQFHDSQIPAIVEKPSEFANALMFDNWLSLNDRLNAGSVRHIRYDNGPIVGKFLYRGRGLDCNEYGFIKCSKHDAAFASKTKVTGVGEKKWGVDIAPYVAILDTLGYEVKPKKRQ